MKKSKTNKYIPNKKQVLILLAFLFFLLVSPVYAQEQIESFDVDIQVNKDTSLTIEENITYRFDDSNVNHGIFRNIPLYAYFDSERKEIDINVISVEKDGVSEPYNLSGFGGEIEIKIGDPDKTVSGIENYSIKYNVEGAIRYLEDIDELYWNVTGNEWNVGISEASLSLSLPTLINKSDIQVTCYKGRKGSRNQCGFNLSEQNNKTFIKASTNNLSPREGMTIAVGFPKGVVDGPGFLQRFIGWVSNNWAWLLPSLVFLFMFWRWYRRGRDPKMGSIMARYSPPEGFKPTLVGSIIDEKVHDRDITAGLIYLAQKGIVSIERIETTTLKVFTNTDYKLTLESETDSLEEDEENIIDIFFGEFPEKGDEVNVSDIKGRDDINRIIKRLKESIHKKMVSLGLFTKSPKKVRNFYLSIGIALVVVGPQITMMFASDTLQNLLAVIGSGIMIILFSFIMPKATKKGVKMKTHILGFKEFLSMTEKRRYEFHNAPEKSPDEFMKNLPYAIALGVEDEWAKQFEGIYITPPTWYSGAGTGRIPATTFASGISDFSSTAGQSVYTASAKGSGGISGSASGGGGFSGGGFGGGGGGSW